MNNYEVYIVNEENQLCPINVPGEIYIGSVGLSKGYLNQEEKTAQVFIKNPFKQVITGSGNISADGCDLSTRFVDLEGTCLHQVEIIKKVEIFVKKPVAR